MHLLGGTILLASIILTAGNGSGETCDFTKGEWVTDPAIAAQIEGLRSTLRRPAEALSNYDCSAYLRSVRLPELDEYTQTLPFCERIPDEKLRAIVRNSVSRVWKPHGCPLPPFNGTKFAQLLARSEQYPAGRYLYFVGDSTLMHMYDSMVCLLGSAVVTRSESKRAREELDATYHTVPRVEGMRKLGVMALNGGGRVYFLRSNHLISEVSGMISPHAHRVPRVMVQHNILNDRGDEEVEHIEYHEVEIPWALAVRHGDEGKGDIMVLHTGIHGHVHRDAVEHILAYLSKHFQGRVIYRTGVPGGEDCLAATAESKRSGPSIGPYAFRWGDFAQWDNLWIQSARSIGGFHLEILDITDLSVQRRDAHPTEAYGHVDCLHYCLPAGPVDVWNRILMMKIMNSP